jgi:hypothetical protein
MYGEWLSVPVGIDAHRWVTRSDCRTVLVVVHTMASAHRLLDVLELIESDQRVQVVFSQAPDTFSSGVADFLRATEAVVLPWHQASRERFDLALAAAYGSLHLLHAPVVLMPHGAGHGKVSQPAGDSRAPRTATNVYGLDAQRLTRDGRLLASALLLAHDGDLAVLRRQCPQALEVAAVVGDPCYDRLLVSLERRPHYRAAIGVDNDQELVVVSSTWGQQSLLGRNHDLLPRLLDELPSTGFRVAALVHPAVWFAHGPRQLRAWLADCLRAGLLLIGPEVDWRAAVVAADHVIGDHGSVPVYAAAIGRPVLQTETPPSAVTAPDSPQAVLRRHAPQLSPGHPWLAQLRRAQLTRPSDCATAVARRLTSRPGESSAELRRILHRLLGLAEPSGPRRATPVPIPCRIVR